MKNKDVRRSEATERNKDYKTLTISQKILKLNLRYGIDKGAIRQRARLAQELIKESVFFNIAPIPGEGRQREPKKPYQKPKKS